MVGDLPRSHTERNTLHALSTTDRTPDNPPEAVYEPRHIPALDGVRGLAIALVMMLHAGAILRDLPIAAYLQWGWMGVDLFFVLSGFLITRILLDTRTDAHYFRRFYIRRGLRIWPLYYLFVVCVVLLLHVLRRHAPATGEGADLTIASPLCLYIFFVQNLNPASIFGLRDSLLSITWSLCIEEHFYLLWPVLVRFLSPRTLPRLLIAILAISPFMRLALACGLRDQPYSMWYQAVNRLTPFHLDSIAAGCLLCLLWSGIRNRSRAMHWFTVLFIAGLALSIFTFANQLDRTVFSFCYSAVAAMFTGLVGMALLGRFAAFFTQPWLKYLGKISFGLYLIHPVVFLAFQSHHLFQRVGMAQHIQLAEGLAVIPAIALSIAIAHLSWKFYESRVLALKASLAP